MSHKPSAIDAIANEYTAKVIELSPMTGSSTGLGERHEHQDRAVLPPGHGVNGLG